jgi:hypothetical protein
MISIIGEEEIENWKLKFKSFVILSGTNL